MPEFENIGGQAVIEGVLMRSPIRYAVAVRRPDGTIGVMKKDYIPLTARNRFWRLLVRVHKRVIVRWGRVVVVRVERESHPFGNEPKMHHIARVQSHHQTAKEIGPHGVP